MWHVSTANGKRLTLAMTARQMLRGVGNAALEWVDEIDAWLTKDAIKGYVDAFQI